MYFGYFLGGALLGAAGLATVALVDTRRLPRVSLPDTKTVRDCGERVDRGLHILRDKAVAAGRECLCGSAQSA